MAPHTAKRVSAVVAYTWKTRAIGKQGQLPWGNNALKRDLKFFKHITTETKDANKRNAVVMGRKTWDSIPEKFRPLPGRLNVILSRSLDSAPDHSDVLLRNDLLQAVKDLNADDTVETIYVVGGGEIYSAAMDMKLLDEVYATEVKAEFEGCDAFFPAIPQDDFDGPELVSFMEGETDGPNQKVEYVFTRYTRKASENTFPGASADTKAVTQIKKRPIDMVSSVDAPRHEEYQYLDLVREILSVGVVKHDRTGTGTKSVFGRTMRFSLRNGVIPLLTTKRTFWKGVALELLWFISGDTSAKTLQDQGVGIWDGNSTRQYLDSIGLKDREEGDLGPVYGFQWRHFGAEYKTMHDDYTGQGVDQLADLIKQIRNNPDSRRIIMSAWNPLAMPQMALPPCHVLSQFYVANGELSCQMYQRSADMGLGVPFNIASYSLLTHLIAKCCGLQPGEFIHVIGDCHVYLNHEDALREQLEREPRAFPKLVIKGDNVDIDKFKYEDLELVDYNPHKAIKMDMAV